ncbi:MAG: hypothetical protein Q4B43_09550 [Bacteroidota bacterium]|nr:hypothetical protein [Bacteroidota bacterium]
MKNNIRTDKWWKLSLLELLVLLLLIAVPITILILSFERANTLEEEFKNPPSSLIEMVGVDMATEIYTGFPQALKSLAISFLILGIANGIIILFFISQIYKILINKRNFTIGTSCKGRAKEISKEIFKDSTTQDYIDYLSLFKSYFNDDWNRDTPFLDKIDILSYYFSHSNSDKKLYSLFTEIKNIPATEKIKEELKLIFKEDYEAILEMKLGQILMFVADLKSYQKGSSNNPQTPEEFYRWRLECCQPKTHK